MITRASTAAAVFAGLLFSLFVHVTPAAAQSADAASIEELRRIVAAQQKQIAAQQRVLEQLQARLDQMSAPPRQMAKATGGTPAGAPAAPAAQAEDDPRTVTSGQDNISLTISGQVNRAALYANDGSNGELFHVDNDNSSTRIRLVGTGKVTDDISLGAQIEVQMESNSTATVSQVADGGLGSVGFTDRKLELWVDSKKFGRVWLGQGSTASDGTAESDLSGTTVVAYSSIADMAGGILFRNSTTGAFGPSVGSVFTNLDGLGRDDRIRYDTPRFYGLQASTSHVSGGAWDAALNYAAKIGSFSVAAAGGFANRASLSTTGRERYDGSLSVRHDSGLSLTLAGGHDGLKGAGRKDATFYYAKLGYEVTLFDIGTTAFAVDVERADDVAANGDEATSYGVFAVQNLKDHGAQFYLGARNHELDRTGANFDDVFALIGGARVKF